MRVHRIAAVDTTRLFAVGDGRCRAGAESARTPAASRVSLGRATGRAAGRVRQLPVGHRVGANETRHPRCVGDHGGARRRQSRRAAAVGMRERAGSIGMLVMRRRTVMGAERHGASHLALRAGDARRCASALILHRDSRVHMAQSNDAVAAPDARKEEEQRDQSLFETPVHAIRKAVIGRHSQVLRRDRHRPTLKSASHLLGCRLPRCTKRLSFRSPRFDDSSPGR